jgi:hypothetical protein
MMILQYFLAKQVTKWYNSLRNNANTRKSGRESTLVSCLIGIVSQLKQMR